MSQNKIKDSIKFVKDFLKKQGISIYKVVLFGSYVTNAFSADSDVDIAIISRDFENKDTFERTQMLKGLDWALVECFMLPFDVIPISISEWNTSSSLIAEFAHQGIEA